MCYRSPDDGTWSVGDALDPEMRAVFLRRCFCNLEHDEEDTPILGHHWTCLEPVPAYSMEWRYCGPIIERERICIEPPEDHEIGTRDAWSACHWDGDWRCGPTPLIAAMRAFVASKPDAG